MRAASASVSRSRVRSERRSVLSWRILPPVPEQFRGWCSVPNRTARLCLECARQPDDSPFQDNCLVTDDRPTTGGLMTDGIQFRGLTKHFGAIEAVDDLSLGVPAGRVT